MAYHQRFRRSAFINMLKTLSVALTQNQRSAVSAACQALDWPVEFCESPTQAFDQLQAGSYDCLITKLVMDDMDGMELINTTRTLFPDIKIIAVNNFVGGRVDYGKVACQVGADLAITEADFNEQINERIRSLVVEHAGATQC